MENKPSPAKAQGKTILLMDDETFIRTIAKVFLTEIGFVVTLAPDGQQAVDLFRSAASQGAPFDLVILDLTVPGGMGGKEALSAMHALNPNVKAIASSGYSDDPIMADPQGFGFCGKLAKPYLRDEMREVLKRVLG